MRRYSDLGLKQFTKKLGLDLDGKECLREGLSVLRWKKDPLKYDVSFAITQTWPDGLIEPGELPAFVCILDVETVMEEYDKYWEKIEALIAVKEKRPKPTNLYELLDLCDLMIAYGCFDNLMNDVRPDWWLEHRILPQSRIQDIIRVRKW